MKTAIINRPVSTVSYRGVLQAEKIIYQTLKPTPLTFYQNLSTLCDCEIYVKHENHLPGGSFKIRGGLNLMHHLKKRNINGVITFSMGNHGISIATAAKLSAMEATIVVPKGCGREKSQLIKDAGANLVEIGDNFEQAAKACADIQKQRDLYYIHPANEPELLHGVGTAFTEILRDLPNLDAIIVPIGGGSELAAAVTVFKTVNPKIEIYAVQAYESQGAYQSWKSGTITQAANRTFAGGVATGAAYELPFSIYKDQLTDFILLSEEEIRKGMYMALLYTHNLTESAGSLTLAAAEKIKHKLAGKKVALQMSGCNETMQRIYESLQAYV